MRKFLRLLIFVNLFYYISHSQDAAVQQVIDNIEPDSLMNFIADLSGEKQVFINNEPYIIKTRYKGTEGNTKAADYLKEKLESYGLTAQLNIYSETGCNVFAVKNGTLYPDKKYFISAHYDDESDMELTLAPGADDNASGCSVVLEAARILSGYSTKYTIIFAFWDEEEQGYVGAKNFIFTAPDIIDGVEGVIESDMVGWDGNNDKTLLIQPSFHNGALTLKDKILETIYTYKIDILPYVVDIGWADPMINLFPIVGLTEEGAQSSPVYHTIYDDISTINKNFLLNNAKVAIGTLASLIEPELINGVENEQLHSNELVNINCYPNPVSEKLILEMINNSNDINNLKCSVELRNILGKTVIQVPEFTIVSEFTTELDLKNIGAGIYFVNIQIGNEIFFKKFIKH